MYYTINIAQKYVQLNVFNFDNLVNFRLYIIMKFILLLFYMYIHNFYP